MNRKVVRRLMHLVGLEAIYPWVQGDTKSAGWSGGTAARTKVAVVHPAQRINFASVAVTTDRARVLEVCLPDGTALRGKRVDELAAPARALLGLSTMLAFPHSVRIYVALESSDVRK